MYRYVLLASFFLFILLTKNVFAAGASVEIFFDQDQGLIRSGFVVNDDGYLLTELPNQKKLVDYKVLVNGISAAYVHRDTQIQLAIYKVPKQQLSEWNIKNIPILGDFDDITAEDKVEIHSFKDRIVTGTMGPIYRDSNDGKLAIQIDQEFKEYLNDEMIGSSVVEVREDNQVILAIVTSVDKENMLVNALPISFANQMLKGLGINTNQEIETLHAVDKLWIELSRSGLGNFVLDVNDFDDDVRIAFDSFYADTKIPTSVKAKFYASDEDRTFMHLLRDDQIGAEFTGINLPQVGDTEDGELLNYEITFQRIRKILLNNMLDKFGDNEDTLRKQVKKLIAHPTITWEASQRERSLGIAEKLEFSLGEIIYDLTYTNGQFD